MTLRKLSILVLAVAVCLCCFVLPSTAFAADADLVQTKLVLSDADGMLLTTLLVEGPSTSDYWVYLDKVYNTDGEFTGVYTVYLCVGMYPSDNQASYSIAALPDDIVSLVSDDFTLTADKMYPITGGNTYNAAFTISIDEPSSGMLEVLERWIGLLGDVFERLGEAIAELWDGLFSDVSFSVFAPFATWLSAVWTIFPHDVLNYLVFSMCAVMFSILVWKGGIV